MKDKQTQGTAKVVPTDQYYNDELDPKIIEDADWMGEDNTIVLYLPDKEQIKRQMDEDYV